MLVKKFAAFILFLIAVTTAGIFLSSCEKEIAISKEDEFVEYVSAYTTGIISRQSTIKVRLVQVYNENESTEIPASLNYLTFEPAIEGETYWLDGQTIEFAPDELLEPDTRYIATFNVGKVIGAEKNIKPFVFDFKTIKREMDVKSEGLTALSTKNVELQKLTGTVETSDNENIDEIKKIVSAEFEGNDVDVKWFPLANSKRHKFIIDSLKRGDKERDIVITWDGSPIGIDNSGEETIKLPALDEFNINKVRVIHSPEQYVSINFTDPLKPLQNLKGLITINDVSNLRFEIAANEIKVYPQNRLYGDFTLNVNEGIKNSLNFRMNSTYMENITFENLKPAVRFVGNGVVIPDNKHGIIMPFEAVNLSAVDVIVTKIFENNMSQFLQVNNLDGNRELHRVGKYVLRKTVALDKSGTESLHKWNRFTLDLNDITDEKAGVVYRVQIGFRKSQSLYSCGNDDTADDRLEQNEYFDDEQEASYWNFYENYYYYGYDWQHRDDPCHNSYYGRRRSVQKNIIHSNIAVIAKRGADNSLFFATTNISTGKPLGSVHLHLMDFQKQVLVKLVTDSEGIAKTKINDKIFMVIAEKGDEKGYLRMDDGSSLSISRFDVGGSAVQKGIKGFIYGDRGVWRPGDSVYVTFILEDLKNNIPEQHPIIFELKNPKQQIAKRLIKQRNESGFYTFIFATELDAPTGNWNAKISLGGVAFSKQIKIETVKPNRLKIKFDIEKPYLTKLSENDVGLTLKWLHGAVAKNLKVKIDADLSRTRTTFTKYSDFTFDDPSIKFSTEPQTIFDGKVNEKGKAEIDVDINLDQRAPGKLRANFLTKAFEPGGDFSIDKFSIDYYPYKTYVGIKIPKGDRRRGMLLTDKDHQIDIVALDIDGNPASDRQIEMKLHKVEWRWWWDQSGNNQSNYSHNIFREELASQKITTHNGKGTWKINVKYPDWGRYIITARDLKDNHRAGKIFYIDWPGWAGRARREQPDGAAMLMFSADKEKYAVGDEVELTIPSGETGRSLISIESGTKVIDSYWFEMEKGENKFTFTATQEMTPNVYANVTLIQPHSQTANDLPIRLYGIIPIYIENPETHIDPKISMPDVLRPEESFKLTVKENNDREMTYTIAIVDEGLLDLTRFKTPDPWNHFYSKEALGVKSWDIYDMVIGAYGGKLEHLLSLGGGEFERPKEGTKVNRFKPMVKFLGPFTIDGSSKTHTIHVLRYVGSVRTMVIAGNEGAYGFAEKTTPVRKPLMVLGTLPRLLGPGENVQLPVSVFAMEENIKNVSITIKPNDMFDIIGSKTKQITFDEKGDQLVSFELKAKLKTGIGKVEIEAISGSEKAIYDIELEIRNPNPIVVDVTGKMIEANGGWEKSVAPFGTEGTNKCILELSSIPPINLGRRLNFLIRYPHGCVEQTTSGAFPQLYLSDVLRLTDEQKSRTEGNIKYAIKRLTSFQISSGGLSYWPGQTTANDWGTTYAGHFLIEAMNKGYQLPAGFLSKWKKYQRNQARNWAKRANRRGLSQAYRLYTLALVGDPEIGAMNRLLSSTGLDKTTKFRLAAAYQLAGKPEVAEQLIKSLDYNIEDYSELGNTFGSALRDQAMILETITLMNKQSEGFTLVKAISEQLNDQRWLSTQTTAYALLAVGKFIGNKNIEEKMNFEYSIDGKNSKAIKSPNLIVQEEIDFNSEAKTISISNNASSPLFVRVIVEGRPITGDKTDASNKLFINAEYFLLDGKKIDPASIEQGTDFVAEVTLKHPGKYGRRYEQMELHQIFPSGWEIINTRLLNLDSFTGSDSPEYQDIRDDRVYTYYNLNSGQSKTFRLLLNASYLGRFYLPTVYSQAMYDNTINARKHGKWVEVVLPGE
ncbi:MAG: hypothetical protein HND52_16155 [Ignavibacteriae bacterium]|nr:hypothetical protein [Ignavibacteriota bacterium]NOG99490.1 hypothetical protein [Ignavibacteriota bacterium]